GDVEQILPILLAAPARDVFADPFEDEDTSARPTLVLLDDGADLPSGSTGRSTLENAAEMTGVRTQDIVADEGPGIARFAALLILGQFTAGYLSCWFCRRVCSRPYLRRNLI